MSDVLFSGSVFTSAGVSVWSVASFMHAAASAAGVPAAAPPSIPARLRPLLGVPSNRASWVAAAAFGRGVGLFWRPWSLLGGAWVVALVSGGAVVPGSAVACASWQVAAALFLAVVSGGTLPPQP